MVVLSSVISVMFLSVSVSVTVILDQIGVNLMHENSRVVRILVEDGHRRHSRFFLGGGDRIIPLP